MQRTLLLMPAPQPPAAFSQQHFQHPYQLASTLTPTPTPPPDACTDGDGVPKHPAAFSPSLSPSGESATAAIAAPGNFSSNTDVPLHARNASRSKASTDGPSPSGQRTFAQRRNDTKNGMHFAPRQVIIE